MTMAFVALNLPAMNADEFLDWALLQPEGQRFELYRSEVIAMAPERASHALCKASAWAALRAVIRAGDHPCQVFPDGMSVRIDAETVYEPDALVRCGESLEGDPVEIADPLIVVEGVSPSSAGGDHGVKLHDYMRHPTIRHYLILITRSGTLLHHRRADDGGIETRIIASGNIVLDPPGVSLALTDLFEGA